MSILERIRSNGGDVTRDLWRFSLKRGRLTTAALDWLRSNGRWRMACREVWPALDQWEERAAIREFCGGLPRAEAERLAYEEVASC